MKKTFTVGKLNDKKMKDSLKSSLVIAYRRKNEIVYSNLDSMPEGKVNLSWDGVEFSIKIKLQEDEYVALGDTVGIAKKGVL